MSQLLPVGARETSGVAHDLVIALGDMRDVPEWGNDELDEAEKDISRIRDSLLHPNTTEHHQEIAASLLPLYNKLAKAPQEKKRQAFLTFCDAVIQSVNEKSATLLIAANELQYVIDYPVLIADEGLHPLLLSIADLELPGELIRGDVTQKWQTFITEYRKCKK